MDWFTVDKNGLGKILERKGKAFAVFELIQNAWDTDAKVIAVELLPVHGRPLARLTVMDDDPRGFSSLAHAWTLFAESEKKGNAEKRGRFNLGEKLVLALCEEAMIATTTGTVQFGADGRTTSRAKTEAGSVFEGVIRMTREELAEVEAAIATLVEPEGRTTTFNSNALPARPVLRDFTIVLPTEIADEDGVLRTTRRTTRVTVHAVREGEIARLYEMGIPVVETGDSWHVNVHQKVPLNLDRDNVSPAYLRALRVGVLNAMFTEVSGAVAATSTWVREAASDPRVEPAAVERVITERFGPKSVIADPTDPEGTKLAVSQGYTVIHGGSLSSGEWANVKRDQIRLPAGQVTPSPKPYSSDGTPFRLETDPSAGMVEMSAFASQLGWKLLGAKVEVTLANDPGLRASATYGGAGLAGSLVLNVAHLGRAWFDLGRAHEKVLSLLVHEFGHHYSLDHLSAEYHDALCDLGARLALLALSEPGFFACAGRVGGR